MPTISTGQAAASERLRLLALFAGMAGGFLFLGATLYRVQVVDTALYRQALEQHSMRRVRLPATRGRILDRRGQPLADNRPSYCVAVFVEELRARGAWSNTVNAIAATLDEVALVLGRRREIDRAAIAAHIRLRRPLPLLAWHGLDDRALARLAESPLPLRGVDIYVLPERVYPQGDRAAHVVGYVGQRSPQAAAQAYNAEYSEEFDAHYDYYLPDSVGRKGIEQRFDAWLAGRPGGQLLRVDAVGYKHATHIGRAPVRGADVVLALDTRWQRVAEESLDGSRGAVLVMNTETGELLVMASAPRFNPAEFTPTLPPALWQRLQADPGLPLVHRATAGTYPPGSIFKPVVALAALDAGIVTPQTVIHCPGYYRLPTGGQLRCWHAPGHGNVALLRSLEWSCNVYYCEIGVRLGFEPRLHADGVTLGLGRRPALEIPASAGFLPSNEWKRRRWRDAWRSGDTANLAIGQGFFSVTPLQMAVMTAALANGGRVLRPRLVLEPPDLSSPVVAQMPWTPEALRAVRLGMYDAVQAPTGTGRRARLDAVTLAGKTGTAEYYVRGVRKKHAWMVAYGPFEQPRYAIVVVVEDADSGGRTAAPLVHRVLSAVFDRPVNPATMLAPLEAEPPADIPGMETDGDDGPREDDAPDPAADAAGGAT